MLSRVKTAYHRQKLCAPFGEPWPLPTGPQGAGAKTALTRNQVLERQQVLVELFTVFAEFEEKV